MRRSFFYSKKMEVIRLSTIGDLKKRLNGPSKEKKHRVRVGRQVIGEGELAIMAGPCAVENEEQLYRTAQVVKEAGAGFLRGGAFKPRTSPYSFQGLKERGLKILSSIGQSLDLPVITEVVDPRDVELTATYCDILQIGTRNMQNYSLLREAGFSKKPILLKRGLAATIEEWLLAAEYIVQTGNREIILCERGIRSFQDLTRFTLDLSSIPLVRDLSPFPIIIDPSHCSGDRRLVPAIARGAVATGAHGLIIEVHNCPDEALCDGAQSLTPEGFLDLMDDILPLYEFLKKREEKKRARG